MLSIKKLELNNFRSYEHFVVNDIDNLTVFVGPNASGKTNAVEAIQLLCSMSSFRRAPAADLVGKNGDACRIETLMEGDGRTLEVAMCVNENKRTWHLNGKRHPQADLRMNLPAVAFTPDDLHLVKGADKLRRAEIDMLGAQLNTNYRQITRDFDKLLRHKNHLLKEEPSLEVLRALNDVFAVVGEKYANYRIALFERLMPHAVKHYSRIASSQTTVAGNTEALSYKYESSWESNLSDVLNERLGEEIERKRTLVGPHLDKIKLYIDGLDASSFASQGQQRSVVLAIKLAEVDVIEEMTSRPPVLLLDDVMSELDEHRRSALVERLQGASQTFITTANIDYFDSAMLANAQIIRLEK